LGDNKALQSDTSAGDILRAPQKQGGHIFTELLFEKEEHHIGDILVQVTLGRFSKFTFGLE
jgi:hypothetical protein